MSDNAKARDLFQRDDRRTQESWHLDKRVPISLIFAIIMQTLCLVIYMAKLDARVSSLEEFKTQSLDVSSRLVRIETILIEIQRRMDEHR